MAFRIILLACIASVAVAAPQQIRINGGNAFNFDLLTSEINRQEPESTTPIVPILRSVDRQNPDGSYTYGYESGDGTYKIETRYPTGEVKGKYGYYDPSGLFREVEYGAAPEQGFMPEGNGLTFVAPQNNIVEEKPVTALPQQVVAPTPRPKPATRQQPILNERIRSGRRDPAKTFIENRGRRVTVIKRKRPAGKRPAARPKPQPVVRPKSQPLPTPAPAPVPAPVPAPAPAPVAAPVQQVIPQQLPVFNNFRSPQDQQQVFQPQQQVFQPQQQVFQPQQQVFQPQQRFLPVAQQQPVQPVSLASAFSAHPFINQFNPSSGVFSYNY